MLLILVSLSPAPSLPTASLLLYNEKFSRTKNFHDLGLQFKTKFHDLHNIYIKLYGAKEFLRILFSRFASQ